MTMSPYRGTLAPAAIAAEEPIEDIDIPLCLHEEPLAPSEIEFWKAAYIAAIARMDFAGPEWARAADRAVVRLRRRIAWGRRPPP